MIIGIGTDIVNIARIERLFVKHGKNFFGKILNKLEIEQINLLPITKKITFLAKRFAAKEAISKALGTGIAQGLCFRDIIISNDLLGKPCAHLISTERNKVAADLKIYLSIADEYPTAVAFAVISI